MIAPAGRLVERPDRDLVAAVRAELAAIEPARACCRAAERKGLGRAASGRAPSPAVGRLAIRLLEPPSGSAGDLAVSLAADDLDWSTAASHCRLAWLRGAFLSRGSLSLAGGRTHLEFVVSIDEADELADRLAQVGLPSATRVRRGRGVVTAKSSEHVVALLRRLGSTAATLELESRLVGRSLRAHMNRVLNAETANLARSVASARSQLADIEALAAAGALPRLPTRVQEVALARRSAPEASFTELAEQLGVSRSVVQRAIEHIAARAADLADTRSAR